MSRAFIRDPEPGEPLCPGCRTPGDEVGPPTLEAQLAPEARTRLSGSVFYCVNPGCRTAYFNSWGAQVPTGSLASTTYPKDPEGPICPCFGITSTEVIAEARDGRKDRIRDLMERSKGPGARCRELCPDGRPCLPRVLRLFRDAYEGR